MGTKAATQEIAPSPLSAADSANVDALTRAMGDQHLTKAQRLEIAEMIAEIFKNCGW